MEEARPPRRSIRLGTVERLPDGRLRFRAEHGTLLVFSPDGRMQSTTSTSFTEVPEVEFMTEEEAWALFDSATRESLGISGKEFLERWDRGEYPDPDAEGVRNVVGLLRLVR